MVSGAPAWGMLRPYVGVDEETLRRMYAEERRTTHEIARSLGCSASTVRRWLRAFTIPVRPRGPYAERLRPNGVPRLPPGWSAHVAYAVGVIATDGNLSRDGRHITITAKEAEYLAVLRSCLGLTNAIGVAHGGHGRRSHRLQWSDRRFYDWLVEIGLTPAKSLTIGRLAVPEEFLADFFRGCLDGDGSLIVYTDRYHTEKNDRYVYERVYVSLASASPAFLEWIRGAVHGVLGVGGSIAVRHQRRNPLFTLRYAKAESLKILRWVYHSTDVPCLARKRLNVEPFLSDAQRRRVSRRGRPLKWRQHPADISFGNRPHIAGTDLLPV